MKLHARTLTLLLLAAILFGRFTHPAGAADSTFVGVLALAVEADVAKQIGLDKDVHDRLKKFVAEKENAAVNLVLEIRDLPPDVRATRIREFATKIEQEGLAMLSLEQRSRLEQIRLERKGMDSLSEPNMGKILQLTDQQKQQVAKLQSERRQKMGSAGEQQRAVIRNDFERKLRAVLTNAQQALWDQLAGRQGVALTQETPQAKPAQPEPTQPEPAQPKTTEPAVGTPQAMPKPAPPVAATEDRPEAKPADSPSDRTEPAPGSKPDVAETAAPLKPAPAEGPVRLQFSFRYQPWKDVLEWLAEHADLSLQVDLYPEGTFNYSDSREYTPEEAIDLINGVLVTKGFTLLRHGRLLTVLDLDAEKPIPDILVEFVPVEKLQQRGKFELVKTIFQLAKLDPTELQPEIEPLIGPGRMMVVMPKSRQILVTGTAGKLLLIKEIIDRAENPSRGGGGAMTTIELQHATAEEVIEIIRPLLGLEEESTRNDDIQIATDSLGKRIFVTGKPDKIQLLNDIVQSIDLAQGGETDTSIEEPRLLTYQIRAADPETVHAVLSTLLAGLPDVRIAVDASNKKLIVLARPGEHKTVVETLRQLEGEAPRFEVIPLKRIDAQVALAVVQNFFGGGGEGEEGASPDAPVVEADPMLNKLFVRGTATQIEQIKDMLGSLEQASAATGEGRIRLIPLPPDEAARAVEQLKRFWPGDNPIRVLVPSDNSQSSRFEFRTPGGEREASPQREPVGDTPAAPAEKAPDAAPKQDADPERKAQATGESVYRTAALVLQSDNATTSDENAKSETGTEQEDQAAKKAAPEIRVEVTPNGVLIYCDDEDALDKFEQLLRTLTGPTSGMMQRKFTVFFLKHSKAEAASQLLQDILGGSSASGSSLISDVTSGLLGGGGGILGAMMGAASGGGGSNSGVATLQGAAPITIVADPRLNALIVQAIPSDIQMLDDLLKVVDREDSMTPVETAGRPRAIPIQHVPAEEVAAIIKEAFADRVAGGDKGQQQQQTSPAELIRALRGGGRGGNNQKQRGELPKMTVVVDNRSNAVIVTAPEQLFRQVEALVAEVDRPIPESTEQVQVVTLKTTDAELVRQALSNILGSAESSSTGSSSQRSASSTATPGRPDMDAIRRRIEMMRQFQQRSAAPSGRPSTGGRGRPSSSGRPSGGRSSRPRGRSR